MITIQPYIQPPQTLMAQTVKVEASDSLKTQSLQQELARVFATNNNNNVLTDLIVQDLSGNERTVFSGNEGIEHFAASVNKVPVSLLVLEDLRSGKLQFDQVLTWQASDVRGGAGVYDQPGAPLQATVKDLLYDLLNHSGNTAVRILVNQGMGGAAAVNTRWEAKPELSHTYLVPLDSQRFYLGYTTAHDSLWALRTLVATQDEYGKFVTEAMATNIWDDMGVRSQLSGSPYVMLVNKIGYLDDSDGNNRHDVGLVYNTKTNKTYAYAMLTTSAYDKPEATALADQSLKDMGSLVLRTIGDKAAKQQTNAKKHAVEKGKVLY